VAGAGQELAAAQARAVQAEAAAAARLAAAGAAAEEASAQAAAAAARLKDVEERERGVRSAQDELAAARAELGSRAAEVRRGGWVLCQAREKRGRGHATECPLAPFLTPCAFAPRPPAGGAPVCAHLPRGAAAGGPGGGAPPPRGARGRGGGSRGRAAAARGGGGPAGGGAGGGGEQVGSLRSFAGWWADASQPRLWLPQWPDPTDCPPAHPSPPGSLLTRPSCSRAWSRRSGSRGLRWSSRRARQSAASRCVRRGCAGGARRRQPLEPAAR
jgi:hypothetical protein